MITVQAAPEVIPFHFVANQIRIDATVQGSGPFHLVLDTGMPIPGVILFEGPRVEALHLADSGHRVRISGAGGDEDAGSDAAMATGVAVSAGKWSVEKTSALVIAPPPGFPPGIDGVIGGELFFHHVVRIDTAAGRIELFDAKTWTPPEGACVLPLDRVGNKIFVDVKVALGDEEPRSAHVVVDTGATHALSLNSLGSARFAPPESAIATQIRRGASGVVLGKVGRARRVQIGSFVLDGVVTTFPVAKHQNPGGEDFHDGNLGEEILRRFDVTFDYAGNRMVLEKAASFGEPFEHEMAGLVLDWEKDGGLVVRKVLPGSPAQEAGIEEGDRIRSIDGRSVADLGEQGFRTSLKVDGAEVQVSVRRGLQVLMKKVKLRRLV
jgi:membrane-associated protease RseP (regulator of RpoE activity)